MLKLGVERGADQDGYAGHPGPDHEPEHGAGRAVEPIEAAHMLDIPGHCRRTKQPSDCRGNPAPADPAPARQLAAGRRLRPPRTGSAVGTLPLAGSQLTVEHRGETFEVLRQPWLVARVAAGVAAVAASDGDRRGAHRLVMEHSLARGGARTAPVLAELIAYLSHQRDGGAIRAPLAKADAFVLIHAVSGVLRAMTSQADAPPRDEIEPALTRMVVNLI